MPKSSNKGTDSSSDGIASLSLCSWLRSKVHMRPPDDDEPQDWWFASTAIPLLAATTGPLANLMSIVALVSPWRSNIHWDQSSVDGTPVQVDFGDPRWRLTLIDRCTALNATSLAFGLVGNFFLLCNFTRILRYIIALPLSIFLWMLSMAILIGLTVSMYIYHSPIPPNQTFSQGYWSAVISAILSFLLSLILMVNMLGYFLGHYPQNFALTKDQRTLILQTTAFVVWLAIGGVIFSHAIDISYANAVYFSDVTVLTVGFGDITATNAVGRALIFPYAVIGIIMLGLVVSSVHRFAQEIERQDVLLRHAERKRRAVVRRSGETGSYDQIEYQQRYSRRKPIVSTINAFSWTRGGASPLNLTQMQEERNRFDAMRAIQTETARYQRWTNLVISILVFAIMWTIGAVVFWALEGNLTYLDALYFAFCSLLTIGYGDITPTTNPARPFFVVWSLLAVPTMTVLISKMSDTIVDGYQLATNSVANWTVLPESRQYKAMLSRCWAALKRLFRLFAGKRAPPGSYESELERGRQEQSQSSSRAREQASGIGTGSGPALESLARSPMPSTNQLGQEIACAIQKTIRDAVSGQRKKYSYEEWASFIRLIHLTHPRSGMNQTDGADDAEGIHLVEDEYGLLNWDWIGQRSPLLAEKTEPEWVLDRLCESLVRHLASDAG
ncbi:hypothetical protein BJX76DRAFT_348620 [Aspergillus varians]